MKKPGRLYQRNDFVELYFNDEHFQYFNKYGEGCFVSFPMYMRSFVKFSPLTYKNDGTLHCRTFTELLSVTIVKC